MIRRRTALKLLAAPALMTVSRRGFAKARYNRGNARLESGDIRVVGVPLTAICNAAYTDPRQRQLFKNIIYVGALAALLDIDLSVMEQLVGKLPHASILRYGMLYGPDTWYWRGGRTAGLARACKSAAAG